MSDYSDHRDRERDRQAEQSRKGRDIGSLPKCANKRRRAKAEKSLRACCETYFTKRFPLPWSEDHLEQLAEIQRVIADGGLQAIAAPRGDGKTTRLECGIIWGVIVVAAHQYAALLSAVSKQAPKLMSSIKMELANNELLLADFPEICYPIWKISGIANRCAGQLLDGNHTWPSGGDKPWARTRIVLPTIKGSACSGAVIEASGLIEATRGIKYTRADGSIIRPSLALIDDPQTNRSAKSPVQCQEREEAMTGGILYLPGPGKQISAFAAVTVIKPGDLADCLLDREQHPEWHGVRKRLLKSWPAGCDPRSPASPRPGSASGTDAATCQETARHWDEYAEIYRQELADGGTGTRATAYYRRHRKIMDRGAEAAWEHRKPGCASAVEFAMRLFFRDRASMLAECQNDPEDTAAGEKFELPTPQQIAKRVNGYERYEVPPDAQRLTFFIDVHKELLYYTVIAWAPGFTGYVIDYGTWPPQSATYFELRHCRQPISKHPEITAPTMEGKVRQALESLAAELSDRQWRTATGDQVELERGACDANWGECTDVVYAFCREARRKHGLQIMPSHGLPMGPAKCPISRWDKGKKGAVGDEWHVPPPARGRGIRPLLYDFGRRRTFCLGRWATPAGTQGSLTLFHAPDGRHRMISEHLTAEAGVKVTGPYGELIVYTLPPGRDNHLGDCVSGAMTVESVCGGKLLPVKMVAATEIPKAEAPKKNKRQRVKYLDL